MEEGKERLDSGNQDSRDEIFSKTVRAGRRTYFFDVKQTRGKENYLTITESKKRYNKEGRYFYEKHKIFLYREDFENFASTLSEVMDFINNESPEVEVNETVIAENVEQSQEESKQYTDVEFEDLEQVTVTANEAEE